MQPRLGRPREARAPTRAAGVNRVSFGVQSMRAARARALGRTHDPGQRRRARSSWARDAGHRPPQPRPHLRHAGRDASPTGRPRSTPRSRSSPTHVSAYALTVEPGTPLGQGGRGRGARRTRRRRPGHEVRARRRPPRRRRARRGTRSRTGRRPGEECRHNLLYWAGGDYAAIGCAAHGHAVTDGPAAAGGTSARPSATSPRSPAGDDRPRRATRRLDPTARRGRAADAGAPHPGGIKLGAAGRRSSPVVTRASTTLRDVGLAGTGTATVRRSPAGAGCSATRSRRGSWSRSNSRPRAAGTR